MTEEKKVRKPRKRKRKTTSAPMVAEESPKVISYASDEIRGTTGDVTIDSMSMFESDPVDEEPEEAEVEEIEVKPGESQVEKPKVRKQVSSQTPTKFRQILAEKPIGQRKYFGTFSKY